MIQNALDEWILNKATPFSLDPSSLNDAIDRIVASLDPSVELLGFGEPEFRTLEARLAAASGPGLFIPTHRSQGLSASEIEALPIRSGSRKNPTYFPLTPQSLADFDALAFLGEVGYSRGGPELP
ncbi:hypothetical protein [Methanothrix harundinacea]|uniref:Erythromycin esterase n=1 Tax=Methanothrix harundinacea (strain 6Ac) TaxID=1110509 RepID=G7WQW6_METH6|nr:hypothetical protein [Methanothrix harundinacea]AET65109.1 Erythromycin esterase [Methanothrix harundinacea 6Ac]